MKNVSVTILFDVAFDGGWQNPFPKSDLLRMASMILGFSDTHHVLVELVAQDQVESRSF